MRSTGSVSNLMDNEPQIRLQLYLARCGVASRRACERLIEQGVVSVDGRIVTAPGTKVTGSERVSVRGRRVGLQTTKRYIALNKPRGYLCANSDSYGRSLASDLFRRHVAERLFHVGRLDLDSEGLIFFTNDGEFARIVTHPSSEIEKEYLVETCTPVERGDLDGFVRGVRIEGVRYRVDGYSLESPFRVRLRLHEGKNREVRHLFRSIGCRVRRLRRTRIGVVGIGALKPGAYRFLTRAEIRWFLDRAAPHDAREGGDDGSY